MASHRAVITAFVTALGLLNPAVAQGGESNGYDFVNPLIGTVNGGHVFPGATLPFGMAKAVADVNGEDQGGFASDDSNITGFSHMHDSGTGGSPSLGNFPLFPQAACPGDDVTQCKFTKNARATPRLDGSAAAHPGYFTVSLATNIKGEMTVTNHTAVYRFTFPDSPASLKKRADNSSDSLSPLMLLDLTDLPNSRSAGAAAVDPTTGRITANGTFSPSFGVGSYKLYTCADFKGGDIRDVGTWSNSAVTTNKSIAVTSATASAGAWARFNKPENNTLYARVGMSFISNDQACSNAEKEIPDFGFDDVLDAAEKAWKDKLSVITLDAGDVDESLQTVFWSAVYRSMISPQDYTGENALWESDEPYYDSYYCIWDSFRSIHQLITLLDPVSQTLMVRSLIDIYRHEGHLPDCRMSLCKGYTQGGSNADVVLSDSYLKGIKDNVDWDTAYEALIADAEIEPPDWGVEGRGNLQSWNSNHYVPTDDPTDHRGTGPFTRSISRTVEYAYDDFCIALVAKGLGHQDDYNKYLERSGWWKNMYLANQTSSINGVDTGFTGFLQPRYLNYTWGFQDPIFCSPLLNFDSCYLNPDGHETYEGSAWLYTFFVPGDHKSLIQTLGGKEQFVKRLDFLHDSGLLYIGDEQGFLPVYQFHYAGRPGKSAYRAHFYIPSQFNDTIVGIPGNDDSGAMGSFSAFTMMGFFPNPGQDVYLISSPFFPSISIRNGLTGNTATIKVINFDAAYKNIYVQSATMNGEAYTKNWFTHSFFLEGGTLELTMGPEESDWGTSDADVPPSISPPGGNGTYRMI